MGLDWKPLNKPKLGKEQEYEAIFLQLTGKAKKRSSMLSSLFRDEQKEREKLSARFFDISIEPYLTLGAPRVGFDESATAWAKSKYDERVEKSQSLEEFLSSMNAYYVVDLVPEHDGIPVYFALHAERHVFRGQFLRDCEQILGEDLLEEAYTSQLAPAALDFGNRIMKIADKYAAENSIQYLKDQRNPPDAEEGTPESNVHILYAATKWLLWWGHKGHGYEADF